MDVGGCVLLFLSKDGIVLLSDGDTPYRHGSVVELPCNEFVASCERFCEGPGLCVGVVEMLR